LAHKGECGLPPWPHSFPFGAGSLSFFSISAWAVWSDSQPIWPDERGQFGWPPDLNREETPEAFAAFFRMIGFELCASGALERGLEKIAIYVSNGLVTHPARQLSNGRWTSKMGSGCDAEHPNTDILCGEGYGRVAFYMCRLATGTAPELPPLKPPPPLIIAP
jgi:hypothetical protein